MGPGTRVRQRRPTLWITRTTAGRSVSTGHGWGPVVPRLRRTARGRPSRRPCSCHDITARRWGMGTTAAARTALGSYGEDVAARHLVGQGMVLLDRNWRCEEGELD